MAKQSEQKYSMRPICIADRERYLAMAEAFYHSPAVLHSIPKKYLERTFEEMLSGSPYVDGYLLLAANGACAGYVLLSKTFSQEAGGLTVWIEELYVEPIYQGQGIGTMVFEQLEKLYPACCRFRLEVEPDNLGAVRLYKRMGFEELGYSQLVKEMGE